MNRPSPGPGTYQIPSKIQTGPHFFMGIKTHYNKDKMRTNTAPGQYTPKKQSHSAAYSMRQNDMGSSDPRTPGPGFYNNTKNNYYKQIPGSKIGKDTRNSFFLRTSSTGMPGSGTYIGDGSSVRKSAPSFGFGTSAREKDYIN